MTQPTTEFLRHVVLFRFKEEATPEEIQTVERAFAALPGQIAYIHAFEWGTDVSVENIACGYTHCFTLTFKSVADRDAYLPHAAHRAFGQLVRPLLDSALVVDYWATGSPPAMD